MRPCDGRRGAGAALYQVACGMWRLVRIEACICTTSDARVGLPRSLSFSELAAATCSDPFSGRRHFACP